MFTTPIFIVKSYAHWLVTSSFVIQVFPTENRRIDQRIPNQDVQKN